VAGNSPNEPNNTKAKPAADAPAFLSPEIWRRICEASFDIVFVIDRDGSILFANQAFCDTVAIDATEICQKSIHILIEEIREEKESEEDMLQSSSVARMLQMGLVKSLSLHLIAASGDLIPILLTASPIELSGDGTKGVVCIAKDLSVERQRDQQVIALRERLNHSVLASMAQVSGGIAHEINNPLAVITGRLRQMEKVLAEEKPDLQSIAMSIANMQAHAARIAFVVSTLRTLSRDSSHDKPSEANATTMILDVLGLFRDRAENYRIRIDRAAQVDLDIRTQQVRLKQALFQVVSNAMTAAANTSAAAPWVRVESKLVIGDRIEIAVTDCGNGIPMELREKIFQPFFSTQDPGKGQGIGLTTARATVEALGGKLFLDTGCTNTRFIIQIPITMADSPEDEVSGDSHPDESMRHRAS